MTIARNPDSVYQERQYPQWVPVLSSDVINEGDLVFWDGTNFVAKPLTAPGQVAVGGSNNSQGFMGAALGSVPALVYGGDPPLVGIPVRTKGVVFLFTTATETYNHFDDVTVGVDSQTVTKTGATAANRVGVVIIDPPAVARASQATPVSEFVTGAAGVIVRVLLEPKHKVGALL